jgi:hypothetical protein
MILGVDPENAMKGRAGHPLTPTAPSIHTRYIFSYITAFSIVKKNTRVTMFSEDLLATIRRTPRNLIRRGNPVRDVVAEKQRAVELARSHQRVEQLQSDLPSLIHNHVGEHMDKLQNKLITDFREMGQRAIEESTAVLSDQLSERIDTLEKVSVMQTTTLEKLRDSSKTAEQKVSLAVDSIERSLSGAVPGGFRLEPSAYGPQPASGYGHPQFQLQPQTEVIKADPREVAEMVDRYGFCPNCTSTNIRRAYRKGLFEEFLRLFFIAPFRCRA